MSNVGYATVSIIPSAKGFQAALNRDLAPGLARTGTQSGNALGEKIGGSLGKTLKRGAIAVGAAAGGILGTALFKGFNRLNSIEQARAKLEGLGNSTKTVDAIMKNALASVKGTAFGLDEAGTVAAGAVASGIKPGKELEKTLSLIGDAATIGGSSMGEMGAIFNKVAASGKLQGDVIAQLGDRGIPILQLLGKELGKTPAEVAKLASAGKVDFATFQKAMEAGLGGAAQKSGQTFTGALANMKAALGRLGAKMLTGVFPQLKGVFGDITGSLDNLGPVAERVGAALGKAFAFAYSHIKTLVSGIGALVSLFKTGDFNGGIRKALGVEEDSAIVGVIFRIRDAVSELYAGLTMPASAVAGIGAPLEGLVAVGAKIRGVFDTIKATISGGLGNINLGALGGLGAILAAVGAKAGIFLPIIKGLVPNIGKLASVFRFLTGPVGLIIGLFATAYATSAEFRTAVNGLLSAIVPLVSSLASSLMPVFTQLVTTLLPVVKTLFAALVPVITQIVTAVTPLIAQLAAQLVPVLVQIATAVLPVFTTLLASIIPIVLQLVGAVLPPLLAVLSSLSPLISALLPVVGSLVATLAGVLVPVIKALVPVVEFVFGIVTEVIKGALQVVQGVIKVVTSAIRGDWSGAWDGIKAILSGAWQAMTAGLRAALRVIGNLIGKAWDWIAAQASAVWSAIASTISGAWDSLTSSISSAWSAVTAWVGSVVSSIMGFLAIVGGWALKVLDWITYPWRLAAAVLVGVVMVIWNAISPPITAMVSSVVATFQSLWASVVTVFDAIRTVIVSVWSAVAGFVGGVIARITGVVSAGFNAVRGVVSAAMSVIRGVISSVWNVISGIVSAVVGKVRSVVAAGFSALVGLVSGPVNTVKSIVSTAFNAVVSTIRGMVGQAGSAAGSVGRSIVDGIKSFVGSMASIGSDIVMGLINGIRGMAGTLAANVRSFIADNVPEVVRKLLGIHSPSRVFAELGKWTGIGFAVGLGGTSKQITSTADKLITQLDNAMTRGTTKITKKGKKSSKTFISNAAAAGLTPGNVAALKSRTKSVEKILSTHAAKRDAIAKKLVDAQKKLADLQKTAADYAAGAASKVLDTGAVVGKSGFRSMVLGLADAVSRAKAFAKAIADLRKAGLNTTTLDELVQAGPGAGLNAARAILRDGGKVGIGQINGLVSQLSASAKAVGATASDALYGAGINAAKGLVKGLESQKAQIVKAMEGISSALVSAVKKSLKIKSPSRVFMKLGAFTGEGMARGIDSSARRVTKAADALAYIPEARLGSSAPASTAGPLVGSLTFTSSGDTRRDIDEALFQLRTINRGGAYARS